MNGIFIHKKWLFELEQSYLRKALTHSFGDYLVQMGGPENFSQEAHALYHYNYYLATNHQQLDKNFSSSHRILSTYDDLPFLPNSLNLVILMHVLEQSEHPTVILKEIYDALAPDGKLIIFSVNPWSLLGISQYFSSSPSRKKVCHWLTLLGFTLLQNKTFAFYFSKKATANQRLLWITEILGKFFLSPLGGVYIIHAKKCIIQPLNKGIRSYYPAPKPIFSNMH